MGCVDAAPSRAATRSLASSAASRSVCVPRSTRPGGTGRHTSTASAPAAGAPGRGASETQRGKTAASSWTSHVLSTPRKPARSSSRDCIALAVPSATPSARQAASLPLAGNRYRTRRFVRVRREHMHRDGSSQRVVLGQPSFDGRRQGPFLRPPALDCHKTARATGCEARCWKDLDHDLEVSSPCEAEG